MREWKNKKVSIVGGDLTCLQAPHMSAGAGAGAPPQDPPVEPQLGPGTPLTQVGQTEACCSLYWHGSIRHTGLGTL